MTISTHYRRGGGGVSLMVLLAVLLPLLTAGALLLVRPASTEVPPEAAPQEQQLTRADIACPLAVSGARDVLAASGAERRGRLSVRATGRSGVRGEPVSVQVTPGGVGTTRKRATALVTGQDALAPGLVATRAGGTPLAATRCPAPTDGQWFSALGGQFEHSSVIELVNPDRGVAVADLTVHTPDGVVQAPELRGLSVPGRSVRRVDLAKELPRTPLMSLAVGVSRGRLSVGVADQIERIGASRPLKDWIPAQADPLEQGSLFGLVPGAGKRMLVLTNPGDDEVQVQVQVVSDQSTFTPTGWAEIRVPPGAASTVPVTGLDEQVRKGALGLEITASAPVVAGLQQLVGGDLSHLTPAETFDDDARTLLPGGAARLVVGGADAAGRVTVVATAADGKRLLRKQVDVAPARAVEIELPRRAASVVATAQGTTLSGVVVLEDPGHAVLPLVAPVERGEVPAVRPALR